MKFDDILQYLGEFGFYQQRVYFLLCFTGVTTLFPEVAIVFLAPTTDHWCKTPQLERQDCYSWGLDKNTCNALKYNITIPEDDEDTILRENNCRRCDVTYSEFDEDTERCKLSDPDIEECEDGWEYDRSQYKATVIQDFDLVCDDGYKASLSQSIYFAGVLVGSFVFGSLADIIGRKKTMFLCMFITLVFGIATAFAPGYWWFTVFRTIVGFSNIGIYLAAFTIAGFILYGVLAYFIMDWRWLQLTITLPNALYFLMIPFIPESVRWLISQKRFDEAEDLIKECAKVNKVSLEELPDNLFEEQKLEMEKAEHDVTYTVVDLFRTPNLRIKTIHILYNWLVISLVYYGLSLSTASLGGRDYLAFILSGVVEIPAYIVAIPAIGTFGRKRVLCAFMILGGVACLTTVWVPMGWGRTTMSLIGKFGIAASFGIIYVFSAELYPTPVRSVGMGTSSMSARVGSILAPIILEIGKIWPPLPLMIFSFMSISAGLQALLLPETLNKELPETIEDGENFGKKRVKEPTSKPTMVDYCGQVDIESSFTNQAYEVVE
ncbi:organic cation transporter protein-like [Antedon mediterranea]|uniref:organic cation transporter protein-like n=1 Tax=Antedon mediterranea TaxID=105859 RepID=UPI003AF8AA0C